jgi:hypothetical protein
MRVLIFLLLLFAGLPETPRAPIAIRHDVSDSLYIALGEDYPFVVRVGENGGDGTLVAADWVLTAAHVAEGMERRSRGRFQVFVDGQNEGYDVQQVILHPDFAPMGPNDIALVRLARPVRDVVPVGYYRLRDEKGKALVLVGHGDTKVGSGGDWVVDRRRRAATNVIDDVNNDHIIFDFDEPGEATDLEGTAGPGDSGGPAFVEVDGNPMVAGVSSLGEPGARGPGTYGAREHYVRVSTHAEWLESVMANPPDGRLVNMPQIESGPGIRRVVPNGAGRAGEPPAGVTILDEIGLLVAERDGHVRMIGRVDQKFPAVLLDGGIRPPAVILSLDGHPIESVADLKSRFDAVEQGAMFELEFEHMRKRQRFEIVKQKRP